MSNLLPNYRQRFILVLIAVAMLSLGSGFDVALAQNDSGSRIYLPLLPQGLTLDASLMRNGADPNYVFSEEELQRIAAKDAAAQEHVAGGLSSGDSPFYFKGSKTLTVGTWKEPNSWAYRNYCGPGATQVALDVRLPASQVPSIDVLGAEEYIDPNWGVYMNNICPVLNNRLSTSWYTNGSATSETQITNWIVADVDADYGLVTGVKTGSMPGWGGYNTNHIVTVYGYQNVYVETSGTYGTIQYTETSGTVAGYNGAYRQSVGSGTFWSYVSGNSAQCW